MSCFITEKSAVNAPASTEGMAAELAGDPLGVFDGDFDELQAVSVPATARVTKQTARRPDNPPMTRSSLEGQA